MKKVKLICIPFAGGGASYYKCWEEALPAQIQLVPVELAGKGSRFSETYYRSFIDAVDDIYNLILPDIIDNNYVIFGHSMGGLIAYYLAREIIKNGNKKPLHCFISGAKHFAVRDTKEQLHKLNDIDFIEKVEDFGGIPKFVLENEELVNLILPALKNDFKLIEQHECLEYPFIDIPITFFGGRDDFAYDLVKKWAEYTSLFNSFMFDGGHFFINEHYVSIIRYICSALNITRNEVTNVTA